MVVISPSHSQSDGNFSQSFTPLPTYHLTMDQDWTLMVVERTMSSISMAATVFVLATFILFDELKRKTFNRLLFLASWGNILTNVATIIGRSGVNSGNSSATCKVQATLIQWFMPADSLWMFCMAVNVFLTFQTTKIHVNLRKLEKWYFLLCFGLPGIPAITYLILDTTKGKDYYGDAILWCWIAAQHDRLRIITFYGPVWIILLLTMTLYAITGRSIYKGQVRNIQMRDALSNDADATTFRGDQPTLATLTKRTAISQTTERANGLMLSDDLASSSSVTLAVDHRSSTSSLESSRQTSRPLYTPIHVPGFGDGTKAPGCTVTSTGVMSSDCQVITTVIATSPESREASQLTVSTPTHPSLNLPLMPPSTLRTSTTSTVESFPIKHQTPSLTPAPQSSYNTATRSRLASFAPRISVTGSSTTRTNRGARTYARVAFLLYVAMLIVWVPSTVNRVYGLVTVKSDGGINFALNLAAAAVLPLQGLFNACIFCFTSRVELGRRFSRRFGRRRRQSAMDVGIVQREVSKGEEWPLDKENKGVGKVFIEV